jgi:hypothetical protein
MRITSLQMIGAAAAMVLFAGCSGGGSSAISPNPGSVAPSGVHQTMGRSFSVLSPQVQARLHVGAPTHHVSFNSCPATGTLVYMSDFAQSVVNIYKGSGLTLCGTIAGLTNAQGMTMVGHDVYVAVTGAFNVQAFHRGATTPFKTFTDPAGQYPVDVAVSADGTVIASNIFSPNTGIGSISTFKSNGTYVGNYVLTNMAESFFIHTYPSHLATYVDGFDNGFAGGAIWKVKCPHGICGTATELGVPLVFPGGLGESNSKNLLANDQSNNTGDTFNLPSLSPVTFTQNGGDNVDMAVNKKNNKWYSADALNNILVCYKYALNGSSAGTCGTAAGTPSGQAIGIAVDPEGL